MVDCAMMHVDWRELTLWQYQAMLWQWNDRHSPEDKGRAPITKERADRLKRAMAAHSVY
jgi:hypothetical protein